MHVPVNGSDVKSVGCNRVLSESFEFCVAKVNGGRRDGSPSECVDVHKFFGVEEVAVENWDFT